MNYPIEEIAYKMKFIMHKLDSGEKLTREEEMYVKKISYVKSICDSLCLERQLKDANIEHSRIIRYLVEKRAGLIKSIKVTKSKNKLEQMRAQISNIEEFITSGSVEYFKDFLIDHNNIPHVDVMQVYLDMVVEDNYLSNTRLEKYYVPYQGSPFVYENRYTNEVKFNRPLIDLVRTILAGDFKAYNALEKRNRLLKSKGDDVTGIEELEESIPEEFRELNPRDISRIMYYARGRIGDKEDHHFDKLRDDLDILAALDQSLSGEVKSNNDQVINDAVVRVLDGVISGEHKVSDFTNYHILKYFDNNLGTTKFREILSKHHFDLESVKRTLLQDDLLSNTQLNGTENLFIDRNGELRLDNISLAASVMNAEAINEDECLSADPKCLGRIKYFQPSNRPNPHDYERDKYDIKILLAIARYKQDLKLRQEQEIVQENNKALL